MRKLLTFLCMFGLVAGCDVAARQQAAEEARREQAAKDLKAIGEAMHKKQSSPPTTEPAATDAAEKKPDTPATSGEASSDKPSDK
jgi:hypothetical protein